MSNELGRVSLKDAIKALRDQLREAAQQAQATPSRERFRITAVELELTVVAEDTIDAGTEVGWWILKAKAGVEVKEVCTHKVKLTLNVGDIEVGSARD